jgi:hypothetical protein
MDGSGLLRFFSQPSEMPACDKSLRSGFVGALVTNVIVEICQKFAVCLASILQGLAGDIEEPMTMGATAPYGDPTY